MNDKMVWNQSLTNYSYQIPVGTYGITTMLSMIQTEMNGVNSNTYVLFSSKDINKRANNVLSSSKISGLDKKHFNLLNQKAPFNL